jgi:hypothetical protein
VAGLFGGSPAEAAPVSLPAMTETQARLLGAIQGIAPTVTTAYTEKQGDDYQAATLKNLFDMNDADNQTSERNNDADNAAAFGRLRLRGGGDGPGPGARPDPAPKDDKPVKPEKPVNVSTAVVKSIADRIGAIRPDLKELGPAAYNAAVRRATEIYQATGNPIASADRAVSEVVGERRVKDGFLGMGSKLEYFSKPTQNSSDF